MSGTQRAAVVIVAIVLAVGAFLVLRPSDDDEGDSPPQTQATQTETAPDSTSTTPEATTPEAEPKQEPEIQLIRVRGGRPVGGVQTIEAKSGDTVRFRVQTETPQEVHLHGYDLTENSTADRPAEFRFKADDTGIYELEIHGTHTQIGELKVEP
jgi:FtsP/CotA-like multicopper oxidase with cupredoxin domain